MKTILIVDDESSLRSALAHKLATDDYKVLTAANGAECLEIVNNETVDLILLDIMMPVVDGIEVARRLNQRDQKSSNPEVIILTNNDDIEKVSEMVANGVFQYFIKADHSLEDLVEIIHKTLSTPQEN